MKKHIALLVIAFMAAVGCSSSQKAEQQKESTVTLLEYKAYTRGSSKQVTVNRKEIRSVEVKMGKEIEAIYPNTPQNWDALVVQAGKIDLAGMETLEAPSKKHQFDGAMGANLQITADGKTYNSVTFDHNNPPAKIAEVVNKILALSEIDKIQVKE